MQPASNEEMLQLEAKFQALTAENDSLKLMIERAQADYIAQAETIQTLQSTTEQLRFLNDESQATVGSLLEKLDEAALARDTSAAFDLLAHTLSLYHITPQG